MSTPAAWMPQSASPVNVLLLMTEHLPHRHREILHEIAKCERRLTELRAEVSRLEKHAAIEAIDLSPITTVEPEDPTP